jgi:hypothetical protein
VTAALVPFKVFACRKREHDQRQEDSPELQRFLETMRLFYRVDLPHCLAVYDLALSFVDDARKAGKP